MKIFLAGNWVDKPKKIEVRNPFDNSVFETVPRADAEDLEKALQRIEDLMQGQINISKPGCVPPRSYQQPYRKTTP